MEISKSLKKNKLKIFYLFILLIIFIIFISLALVNFELKRMIPQANLYSKPIDFSPEDFPTLLNNNVPYISAQGAIVIDRDSLVAIYEKNPTLRFSPASTTKIMTTLVAMDYFKKDDILTVQDGNVEGATISLTQNEQFRFEDLLYAMMLPSANDAAKTIAMNYPGGEKVFVSKMNEKAKELGLNNTHFEDPIGLIDQEDYTTPIDLARLAGIAMQNPEFRTIVGTKEKKIRNSSGKEYQLENLNVLLDIPGVNGVKTGFTEEAGQVLVTSTKVDGTDKELIIIVMQSTDRFGDTRTLLDFLKNNVTYLSIHP